MKDLTKQFQRLLKEDEDFLREASHYERAVQTPQWKFLILCMQLFRAEMLKDMVSKRFTDLEAVEKDVTQKVYYHLSQLIDFLSSPRAWIQEKNRFQRYYEQIVPNLTGKGEPNSKRKGK